MPGFFSGIAAAVEREYERRIRRASLITEYGAAHHVEDAHHADDAEGADDGVAIANLPRGAAAPAEAHHAAQHTEHLEIDPPPPAAPVPATAPAADGDDGEAEIVNTPPGAPVR